MKLVESSSSSLSFPAAAADAANFSAAVFDPDGGVAASLVLVRFVAVVVCDEVDDASESWEPVHDDRHTEHRGRCIGEAVVEHNSLLMPDVLRRHHHVGVAAALFEATT